MEIIPIASSSDGNATFVRSNGSSILIDCGVSLRELTAKLGQEVVKSLGAVFITHEHTDHIKGTPTLLKRSPNLPIYIHDRSYRIKRDHFRGAHRKSFKAGVSIPVGGLTVTPFPTHHDAESSHGFFIEDKDAGHSLCHIADTGYICDKIKSYAERADYLFIECDYDEEMLDAYPGYSELLKERISSSSGHLSNRQTLDFLAEIGIERFRRVIFAHLSPRTNSPETLMAAARSRFGTFDRFEIAGDGRMSLPFHRQI